MKAIRLDATKLDAMSFGAREDGFAFAIVPNDFDSTGAFEMTRRTSDDSVKNAFGDEVIAEGLGDTKAEAWEEAS